MELLPGNWKTNNIDIEQISLKSIAHLGDGVYELFIRRKTIFAVHKIAKLHKVTTLLVKASYHAELLNFLIPQLNEKELVLIKRARNLSLTSAKRRDHTTHRLSTSFEALIGYLYLADTNRLEEVLLILDPYIDNTIKNFIDEN